MSCSERLSRALSVALPVHDILECRVEEAVAPAWCERRGWTAFLLGLDDATVRACEAHGLAQHLRATPNAPSELRELSREIENVTSLPRLRGATPLDGEALRSVRLRKRAQLSGLLAAVSEMAAHATRVVDVGAGSGHFTRLSAELFQRDALGLEHNPERVASARRRAHGETTRASFAAVDARQSLSFSELDLAIGLHACGELGDRLVEAAAGARCDLALVSCCLQKISTPERPSLSSLAADLRLRREYLGLTNLTAQAQGVEASIEVTLSARQTRYALYRLLRARGIELEPGAEMSGINRRQANAGLAVVAAKALLQRDLPGPSDAELRHFAALAAEHYAIIRRLSLPRSMLARLVEVLVSLDRAAHLEERGLLVLVATLFEQRVSPRNIGVFASQAGERLPAA